MANIQDRWYDRVGDRKVRSARYRKGLRWLAEWRSPDGHKHRKAFPSKDAAQAFIEDQEADKRRGLYIAPNKVTMAELWPRWQTMKSALAKTTREGYDAAWSRYVEPRWGDVPLGLIDRASVMEWLPTLRTRSNRKLSASWSRKVAITMRGLLDMAVDGKLIPSNPLQRLGKALPEQLPSERRYLSVAEVDTLITAMEDHALPVQVLIMTGIRRGEMAGLQVRDLDVSRGRLRIARDVDADGEIDQTKTRRHRDVPVADELLTDLRAATKGKGRTATLLPAPGGEPWRRDTWRPIWEKARAAAGLNGLDTHELRHTAVSLAIHSGANVKTVQRMVGHTSASITLDVYGHMWDDELDSLPGRMKAFMEQERKRELDSRAPLLPPSEVKDMA